MFEYIFEVTHIEMCISATPAAPAPYLNRISRVLPCYISFQRVTNRLWKCIWDILSNCKLSISQILLPHCYWCFNSSSLVLFHSKVQAANIILCVHYDFIDVRNEIPNSAMSWLNWRIEFWCTNLYTKVCSRIIIDDSSWGISFNCTWVTI